LALLSEISILSSWPTIALLVEALLVANNQPFHQQE
jgi:hypothetical protein